MTDLTFGDSWSSRRATAWLLRVHRTGGGGGWESAARFSRAFPAGAWRGPVTASMISRWETGHTVVPLRAVQRYEELLGLPEGLLVSAVNALSRYTMRDAAMLPALLPDGAGDGAAERRRVGEWLEKACSPQPMSGRDWTELTGRMMLWPQLVLVPQRRWREIAERLLLEMITSRGLAWTQRFEAYHRLLGHADSREHAVAACVELVRAPDNQVPFETTTMLDACGDPLANAAVLGQIAEPTSAATLSGALTASVRKLRFGHFDEGERQRLQQGCRLLRGDSGLAPQTVQIVAAILDRLADRGKPAGGGGRLPAKTNTDAVVRRVVEGVVAGQDGFLATVVDEMLFSPLSDRRFRAAWLIRYTPLRRAVAAALAAESARAVAARADSWCGKVKEAMEILVQPTSRRRLQRHTGRLAGPEQTDDRACYDALLDRHSRVRLNDRVIAALVFEAGMGGQTAVLQRIHRERGLPAGSRNAARWWLSLPAAVRDSVRADAREADQHPGW